MPELPEVETIKRGLENKVTKKVIQNVWIEPSFRKKVSPRQFEKEFTGKSFKHLWRRAKLLVFEISERAYLLIHLKMTGQLVYRPGKGKLVFGGHPIGRLKQLPNKFTRVIFTFKDKSKLFFNDVRKFGFLKVVDEEGLAAELEKYGREPVNRDFTLEFFCEVMKKRPNKRIKEFLLEQKLIAGIGNIYADESLYRAKIKPTRRVKTLRRKEKQALYQAVKYILNKAIKHRGTSVSDYVNSEGGVGQFQNYLKVYGCGGKACVKCKTIISKIKLGSRSASFCPVCQK